MPRSARTILASIVGAVLFGILAWLATIGLYRAGLKTSLGEAPGFHNLTSSENLGKYVVVAIVYGLLSAIGLVLCILPGIIVIFLFQFSPFYALDKGQGVGEAFGNSYRVVTKNLLPVIITAIVNIVAAFVGSFLYGILTRWRCRSRSCSRCTCTASSTRSLSQPDASAHARPTAAAPPGRRPSPRWP